MSSHKLVTFVSFSIIIFLGLDIQYKVQAEILSLESCKGLKDHKNYHMLDWKSGSCGVGQEDTPSELAVSSVFQASSEEFPWLVMLTISREGSNGKELGGCTGSLITNSVVLTAAQCFGHYRTAALVTSIVFPTEVSPFDHCKEVGNMKKCGKFVVHPEYNPWNHRNNIALIYLENPNDLMIPPVCLPLTCDLHQAPTDDVVFIEAGFYIYSPDKTNIESRPAVQKIHLPALLPDKCDVRRVNLCTRGIFRYDSTDNITCGGNAGGPLLLKVKGLPQIHYLVGLTTWDDECFKDVNPRSFTRVAYYMNWILDNLVPPGSAASSGIK